jgi:hypothetical protein
MRKRFVRWEDGFQIENRGHVGWFGLSSSDLPMVRCCSWEYASQHIDDVLDTWREHVHG